MKYKIEMLSSVTSDLGKIKRGNPPRWKTIKDTISELANNPRPSRCTKLKDRDAYRLRVGEYRIIYTINDEKIIVTVIRVGTRGNVYKKK